MPADGMMALLVTAGAIALLAGLLSLLTYLQTHAATQIGHHLSYELRRELLIHHSPTGALSDVPQSRNAGSAADQPRHGYQHIEGGLHRIVPGISIPFCL